MAAPAWYPVLRPPSGGGGFVHESGGWAVPELLLLNGPNLRLLGRREPEIYGTDTLADVEAMVAAEVADRGWTGTAIQSDSEAELIRIIEDHYDTVGLVINPGALMMAGWSLRDALKSYPRP